MKSIITSFIYTAYFILFSSCSTKHLLFSTQSLPCYDCLTYKMYIERNWEKDSLGYYYFKSPPECEGPEYIKSPTRYTGLLANNCFKGMSTDSLLILLGQPSKKLPNRFDYYLNDRCEGREGHNGLINGCKRLRVYLSPNNKIVGVSGIPTE